MKLEYRFWLTGDIRIDLLTQKAYHHDLEIKLSDLSFKAMLALVAAFPEPLSNDDLIDQVWQQTAVSPETVTQRMALIRKALNEAGFDAKQHLTVTRHVGYRWLEPVTQTNTKNSNKAIVGVILLIIGLLSLWGLWLNFNPDESQKIDLKTSASVSSKEISNQAWNYLDKHNAQSNQLAIGLFRKALAENKSDINALTGLSIALSHEVTKFNQSANLLEEARELALKATDIEPLHAQAWAALAFVDDANGEIDTAIQGYEKAIELAPNNTSTISSLAYLYAVKGRVVDAIRLNVSVLGSKQLYLDLQIAQSLYLLGFEVLADQWFYKADVLSPDNVFTTHQRAHFYLCQNQTIKARKIIDQALERGIIRPELPRLLGLMAWKNGEIVEAINHFKTAISIDESDMQSFLLLQSLSSKNQQLKTNNHEWLTSSLSWPEQSIYQAQFYAQTGQVDAAFIKLKRAIDQGYRDIKWLQWLPAFDALKADSRWPRLLAVIQDDVDQQKQLLLNAEWLPTSFLDPKN